MNGLVYKGYLTLLISRPSIVEFFSPGEALHVYLWNTARLNVGLLKQQKGCWQQGDRYSMEVVDYDLDMDPKHAKRLLYFYDWYEHVCDI